MNVNNVVLKESELIRRYVDERQIPGACFSIVTPKEIAYSSYGNKALVPEEEVTSTDTLYDIASLSKVVSTSTMIAKLIEEGRLSFDTKVSSVLADFPHEDITVKDLLVHTSGYPADDRDYKKCKGPKELYDFILRLPRTYKRGEKVEYSCFNYLLLGRIIDKLCGDMEDYAKEVLFDHLGSEHIMYKPNEKGRTKDCAPTEVTEARGIIQGEVHDGKAHIMGGVAGNAGVFADIEALSRFAQMMLSDGVLHGETILKKETMELFKTSYTEGLNESRTMGGWYFGDLSTSAGTRVSKHSLYHTGFAGTSIYIDFERKCGIVLLTNAIHPKRESPIAAIRKVFHEQLLDYIDRA